MANWKERGEVLDSDDEEDLDSQSDSSNDGQDADRPNNGLPGRADVADTHEVEEEDKLRQDDLGEVSATPTAFHDLSKTSTPIARSTSQLEKSASQHKDEATLPASSQASQKAFKVPAIFWELEEDNAIKRDGKDVSKHGGETPPGDDISRSYVQITSPTSSILSSPPGSQISQPPNAPVNQKEPTLPQSGTRDISVSASSVEGAVQPLEVTRYAGRSFRQRNPIQLHPYIVEQEKYRQTLKSRGIAPMRIAPSLEESQRRSRSPEHDSQEKDSQDATETGDSQPLDFNWDPMPSSSPLKASEEENASDEGNDETTTRNDDKNDSDDDEFPDIDELLSTRLLQKHSIGSKRRPKSYSNKYKHNLLSKTRTPGTSRPNSVFDVPTSPPATSSPLQATSRNHASSTVHSRSISPDEATLPLVSRSGPDKQRAADLPTPGTSAAKPIPILVDSDLESAASEEDPSSSDESVQIRKVGKKIRGVLPASHIRLDFQQKKPQAPARSDRQSLSVSPVKASTRRGVALPRVHGLAQSTPASTDFRLPFFSDDSDEEDNGEGGFIVEENTSSAFDSLFSQSRLGVAEEDDRIDALLPSRKRQSTKSKTYQAKRRRVGLSKLSRPLDGPSRQPKITEHIERSRQSASSGKSSRQVTKSGSTHRRHVKSLSRKPAPPRLSILDVADTSRAKGAILPQFIRVAARTARSKSGLGKQSPSGKFIRLANREDTYDAQSVLEDWREGRILAKPVDISDHASVRVRGLPLNEIENNRQTTLQSPIAKIRPVQQILNSGHVGVRRQLLISKPKQQSMNAFITREETTAEQNPSLRQGGTLRIREGPRDRPRYVPPAARFAQLESSDLLPATAFRFTKRNLDALYRLTRKRPAPQANLQLSRFLADEDIVQPTTEPEDDVDTVARMTDQNSNEPVRSRPRIKKRVPKRVDAGAAIYRQPSDPLILDFLVPTSTLDIPTMEGSKLLGLAKFGTKYPVNFDISPLPPGVFFYESTFIGSGRLSTALKIDSTAQRGVGSPVTSLSLAGKNFNWGQWDEDVSSEMGVGFDWLVDQLLTQTPPMSPSSQPTNGAVDFVDFVLEYSSHSHNFGVAKSFLGRMVEILEDISARLDLAENPLAHLKSRPWIEVMSISTLLLLDLLRTARTQHEESLAFRLEDLLKKFSSLCVRGLLSEGLECIRKLYDDLQYLSFREIGIRDERFVTQAWVILIKVLDAARIPKGSFWDLVNLQISDTPVKDMNDARMMEKVWYSMFTLLPLCEFDAFGVVIEDQRLEAAFDNWSLPQQMLKRVFALYSANPRQSPGFNDYCRSIVSRCHYLMVEWGWWNSSGVIGTLFDFFGSHNLAHLRNEEVYASPHFLEELDLVPRLDVESEDRCFHIFLKIVALAIKHFRQVGDGKAVRNLVARLLPNHNRQYPKEESIHQRDLASLRNHHDLLCTLYWAAPVQYRPSTALIQELVVADCSHKEACLINLRAWGQLSRFVLAHDATEEDTYTPLKLWHQDFFGKLVQQYLQVETETREQALALQGGSEQILHEARLQEVIMANRRTIIASLCASYSTVAANVRNAPNLARLVQAFRTVYFSEALQYRLDVPELDGSAFLAVCLKVITNYMDRAEELRAAAGDGADINATEVLSTTLSLAFPGIVRRLVNVNEPFAMRHTRDLTREWYKNLLACWARYIAMATDETEGVPADFPAYFTGSYCAVFQDRSNYKVATFLWPYFLAQVLKYKRVVEHQPLLQGCDFEIEWLLLLTKHDADQEFEMELTTQLQRHGFGLSAGIQANWPSSKKLQRVIEHMGEYLGEIESYRHAQLKARYATLLVDIQTSIRLELQIMQPTELVYESYLQGVHKVADKIKRYAGDICQLDLYFLTPSSHYRPDEEDPEFYEAGILRYCHQLPQQRQRASASLQLFYYLHTGWKKALVSGTMHKHTSHIKRAMKNRDFKVFLLSDFVPAIIRSGFRSAWNYDNTIWLAYLPSLAERVERALNVDDESDARETFRSVIKLLRMIMNCLLAREPYDIDLRFPKFQYHERNVRTAACKFWLEVTGPLLNHGQRFRDKAPEDELAFKEIHDPFVLYLDRMDKMCHPEEPCEKDWRIPPWAVEEGEFCGIFERALEEDVFGRMLPDNPDNTKKSIRIGSRDHFVDITQYIDSMPTFRQVLQYGRIGSEATVPTMKNMAIVKVVA